MPGSSFLTTESLSGLLKGDLATINHAVADQFVLCSLHLNHNTARASRAPSNQDTWVACKIVRVMLPLNSSAYLFQVEFLMPAATGSVFSQALVGIESIKNAHSESDVFKMNAHLEVAKKRIRQTQPMTVITQRELVSFLLTMDSANQTDQFDATYAGSAIHIITPQSILGRQGTCLGMAEIDGLVPCAPYKVRLPAIKSKMYLQVRHETPIAMKHLDAIGATGRASSQHSTADSSESIIQFDSCLNSTLDPSALVEYNLYQFGFEHFFPSSDRSPSNQTLVKNVSDIEVILKECHVPGIDAIEYIADVHGTVSGWLVVVDIDNVNSHSAERNDSVVACITRVNFKTSDFSFLGVNDDCSNVSCGHLEFEIAYCERMGATSIRRRHTVPGEQISHQTPTTAQQFEFVTQYSNLATLTPPKCVSQNQLLALSLTNRPLSELNSQFRNGLVTFKRGGHVFLGRILGFVEDKDYEYTADVTLQHRLKVIDPNITVEDVDFTQISNVQPSSFEQFEYDEFQANQRRNKGVGGTTMKLTLDANQGLLPNTVLPENLNLNQLILDCQRQLSRHDLLKRYVGHYVSVDRKLYSKPRIDAAVGKVCDISLSSQEAWTKNASQGYDLVLLIIEKSKSTLNVFVKRLSLLDVRVKEFNPYHEHLKAKLEQIIGAYPLIFSSNTSALYPDPSAQSHFRMDPREVYEIDDDLISMPNVNARHMSTPLWLQSLSSPYLRFDDQGNPVEVIHNQHGSFTQPLQMRIAIALYKLAEIGEGALANRIKIALASAGYLSPQVDGAGQAVNDTIRPNTFQRIRQLTQTSHPSIAVESKNKIRYWDWFDFYIYQGMKACRRKFLARSSDYVNETDSDDEMLQSADKKDAHYNASHYEDYAWRKKRVDSLHQAGELLTRVVDAKEITQCFGYQYRLDNNSLSTSLLPPRDNRVNMRLFIDGADAICLFLDGHCAASQDYGATFFRNAYTAGDGFLKQASRRTESHASASLSDMRQLFIDIDALLRSHPRLDYTNLNIVPDNSNRGRWRVNVNGNGTMTTNTPMYQMPHNETTYYRPAERHMIIALGIKCNQIQYTGNLKKLVLIQSLLRTQKQIFLPIYRLDSKRNQLEEIVIGEMELAQLQLTKQVVPYTRGLQADRSVSYFEKLMQQGRISAADLSRAMSLAESSPRLAEITNIMMMSLHLNEATDTIGVYDDKKGSLEEVRLLDNMHLVFPGNFETANKNAYRPELRFSEADIKRIKSNDVLKKVYKILMFENLKKMVGIDFNQPRGQQFSLEKASLYDLNELPKGASLQLATKVDYARVLTRVHRSFIGLELVDKTSINAVFREIQTIFPKMVLYVTSSISSKDNDDDDTKSCVTGVSDIGTTHMHFGVYPYRSKNNASINKNDDDDDTKSCATGCTIMGSRPRGYVQPPRGL